MKRLLALVPALLLAAPVLAQEVPEGAYQNLWCGIAFGAAAAGTPNASAEDLAAAAAAGDDATPEQFAMLQQDAMLQQFTTGGQGLVDTATASYKEAGFTDEQFTAVEAELRPKVETQISGTGADAEFSFEQCFALLPPPA